jgi:hypothetical protein
MNVYWLASICRRLNRSGVVPPITSNFGGYVTTPSLLMFMESYKLAVDVEATRSLSGAGASGIIISQISMTVDDFCALRFQQSYNRKSTATSGNRFKSTYQIDPPISYNLEMYLTRELSILYSHVAKPAQRPRSMHSTIIHPPSMVKGHTGRSILTIVTPISSGIRQFQTFSTGSHTG